jgi:hypothetical protein
MAILIRRAGELSVEVSEFRLEKLTMAGILAGLQLLQ